MKDKLQIQKSKTDRVYKNLSVISKIPGYFSCIRDQRVLWLGHRIPLLTFDNHGHYPFRCGNILLKLNALMKTMELWSKFMPFHFTDYCKHRIIFFKKINIVKTCVR